jgi:hypothetical protein
VFDETERNRQLGNRFVVCPVQHFATQFPATCLGFNFSAGGSAGFGGVYYRAAASAAGSPWAGLAGSWTAVRRPMSVSSGGLSRVNVCDNSFDVTQFFSCVVLELLPFMFA